MAFTHIPKKMNFNDAVKFWDKARWGRLSSLIGRVVLNTAKIILTCVLFAVNVSSALVYCRQTEWDDVQQTHHQ